MLKKAWKKETMEMEPKRSVQDLLIETKRLQILRQISRERGKDIKEETITLKQL